MRASRGLWMCLLSVVVLSTSARAELVQLTCPGTEATHFVPGITQASQKVAFTGHSTLGPCVGLPLGVISASIRLVGSGTLSCSLGSSAFTLRIDWSDGSWSTVEGESVINARPAGEAVIVLTGEVTQGRFLAATVVRTLTLLQTDLLACWTPEGVTDVAGVATLTVSNLL